MSGDSNRRHFLKAMGLTAVAAVVPAGLGVASVAGASAPAAAAGGVGALELWLLDTGAGALDAGLYGSARQGLVASLAAHSDMYARAAVTE